MKRILTGLVAFTAVMCTFTGCSKQTSGTDKKSEATEVTTENENTTAEDTTEAATSANIEDADFESMINEFIDAYNKKDYQKTFEMQMPDGMMKLVKVAAESADGDVSEDSIIEKFQDTLYSNWDEVKVKLVGITETEPLGEKDMLDARFNFGLYKWMIDYIEENGADAAMEEGILDKEPEGLSTDEVMNNSGVNEGFRVNVELENTNMGTTFEGSFDIFDCGGIWKINPRNALSYYATSEQKMLADACQNIFKAQNTAMVEMDEEFAFTDWQKCFIVSSDGSRDYEVPEDFDTAIFMKKTEQYFGSLDKVEWFTMIYQGCAYCTAYVKDKPETLATFPEYIELPQEDGRFEVTDDMSYDERFETFVEAAKKINNK